MAVEKRHARTVGSKNSGYARIHSTCLAKYFKARFGKPFTLVVGTSRQKMIYNALIFFIEKQSVLPPPAIDNRRRGKYDPCLVFLCTFEHIQNSAPMYLQCLHFESIESFDS